MPKSLPKQSIKFSWLFKMAWRDSRKNRARLLLFISAIVLGIAALVAVYSFKDNLQKDIDSQAKELTGADLVLDSRKGVSKAMQKMLDTLGDERSQEKTFASMIYFQKGGGSRLVQMKALEGNYPYYGTIETIPLTAAKHFQSGRNALVDQTLMLQFNAKVGDSVKIGDLNFNILGTLTKAPGQTGIGASIAPTVYIPLQTLDKTNLIKTGSRINNKFYFRYNNPSKIDEWVKKQDSKLEKEGFDADTVESRKEQTGRSFKDVNRFLALSGFIALLLGCVGVGSAIHVYIQEKLSAIATLRCLGLKSRHAFLIYLIQVFFIGLIAAVLGAALGTGIQFLLPLVLKDFLPIEITMQVSWPAVGQGILLGLIISVLFALPSLLSVRRISPLNAIRISFEKAAGKRDPLTWLVYLLMAVFITAFTHLQMKTWIQTLAFTASIAIAFVLLIILSKLLMFLVRKLLPNSSSYLWRQGFANLYRPNNQTLMLTVSIGLSTAFICTLFFVQGILMSRVTLSSGANQPNMVMFDIQNTQKEGLDSLTKAFKLPLMNQVPVVTMRIEEINGKKASADTSNRRAYRNEIRATYQDTLTAAEKITSGKWIGKIKPNETVYISLDQRYAQQIHVELNDKILFNVQGMMIPTVVGSLREVNWSRMQTNFRVVFPAGVLEEAPQFHVLMTRIPSGEVSARFQGEVVQKFPNVSVIDLDLVLKLLDELLSKIGFVIQFMAGFSMVTGWIVLISSVLTSKNQRIKESILLRTMGASRKQILAINAIEYFFLGAFAAGAGLILAISGSWALAKFTFDAAFVPPFVPTLLLFGSIVALVVITGVLSTRSILNQPPLKILRTES
ncbi:MULTISPECIES: ABC transporter permease [unclassified Pedobacter]|uniref:ABC transporter permease n=1 Tax=unclassified Pedobacter TaxID=2628915 RepID=UPI00141E2CD7|nr:MULTISPECIES: FtsX-like permease family protein [unclassified Pedobacter]NII81245.1 putative ABC transport system permease protein [Pedobacter sp. SG908]NMN35251.1 putative ABC transport system permease protein [Pedobacter sp. SG918]